MKDIIRLIIAAIIVVAAWYLNVDSETPIIGIGVGVGWAYITCIMPIIRDNENKKSNNK